MLRGAGHLRRTPRQLTITDMAYPTTTPSHPRRTITSPANSYGARHPKPTNNGTSSLARSQPLRSRRQRAGEPPPDSSYPEPVRSAVVAPHDERDPAGDPAGSPL